MRCPICHLEFEPASSPVKPFCSKRCQTIDLGRWLGESYSMPHAPDPEDDEQPDDNWSGEQPFEATKPSNN
ncbi:MAG: DNA gyrase inhibitor YacG [Bythopirellula sp.]